MLGGGLVMPDNRLSAFGDLRRGHMYAVMDGVGGAILGMAAAQTVADQLADFYTGPVASVNAEGLQAVLQLANQTVSGWGLMEGTQRPAGASTVTLAWFSPSRELHILHAGDSAGFLLRANRLVKVTADHENSGGIFKFVGQGEAFRPEHAVYRLTPDDAVCLVSDGVTKGVKPPQMETILQDYAGEPDLAAKQLVLAAKKAGVQDDITALVIELLEW